MTGIHIAFAPAVALHAATGAGLPTRVKLLGWGRNETSAGPVIVDDQTAAVFAANQKRLGRERVQIDYEHSTVPGTPEYQRTTEPRAVAGHSALVCVPQEGIFAEAVTYTAGGEAAAKNFEDASLAPFLDRERRVIAAHSWTLTHAGAAAGIHFAEAATLAADFSALANPNHHTSMDITLAELAELAGLSATTDKPAVLAALKTRLAFPAAADLTPLAARLEKLEGELTLLRTAGLNVQRAELVTLFASAGKVPKKNDGAAFTTAELQALDLATLQILHANTPVTVALSARTAPHHPDAGPSYKDPKTGLINLAGLFDAENLQRGTATPNII